MIRKASSCLGSFGEGSTSWMSLSYTCLLGSLGGWDLDLNLCCGGQIGCPFVCCGRSIIPPAFSFRKSGSKMPSLSLEIGKNIYLQRTSQE